ncbi:2-keto-4-pentenoate hydratase [Paeniglutamicibacter sp. R2-26]|uniref:2-keto-4-pentenoate hydratase n=1 Tax=Paeniglutamicibacter sp. R2-26 TaxID=3144417 RepID=UPI003EE76E0A
MQTIPDGRLSKLHEAADILVEARHNTRVIDGLPIECQPRNLEEGYAISDLLADKLDWPVTGWFCGATNPIIQRMLRISEPYCARLFEHLVHNSPATLQSEDFPPTVIETEVAFRLARDLPPRDMPYTEDEVSQAVESVCGSIEVVAGHLKDWSDQEPYSVIADNGTDGALVVGAPCNDWRSLDLSTIEVEVSLNGEVVRTGVGSSVLSGPLEAMTWLANAHAVHGGLKAGHIHNTGTLTSILPVGRGDEVVANFGELGAVSLHFV